MLYSLRLPPEIRLKVVFSISLGTIFRSKIFQAGHTVTEVTLLAWVNRIL